jgi:hypothetical protein
VSPGLIAFLVGLACGAGGVVLLGMTELGKSGYHVLGVLAALAFIFAWGVGATLTETPGSGPAHEAQTGINAAVAAAASPHFGVGYVGIIIGVLVGLGFRAIYESR